MMPELSEHGNNISLNEKLFARIRQVYEMRNTLNLTTEEMRLLEKTYDGFIRNGANLSDQDKETFRKISMELSSLTLKFSQNHLKETNKFELQLTDKHELEGLPESASKQLHRLPGKRAKEGWIITLQLPAMYRS